MMVGASVSSGNVMDILIVTTHLMKKPAVVSSNYTPCLLVIR